MMESVGMIWRKLWGIFEFELRWLRFLLESQNGDPVHLLSCTSGSGGQKLLCDSLFFSNGSGYTTKGWCWMLHVVDKTTFIPVELSGFPKICSESTKLALFADGLILWFGIGGFWCLETVRLQWLLWWEWGVESGNWLTLALFFLFLFLYILWWNGLKVNKGMGF